MKNSKRHGRYDPVFVGTCFIDNNYENSHNQECQQEAPAFPSLNQHFVQVILNINSADYKWNDQQAHGCNNPDRSRESRKCETNMRNQVFPIQLMYKIQNQYEEIIRRSKSNKANEPFLNSKWAHNQQSKKKQDQKRDCWNIKQGCKTQKDTDIKYRCYRVRAVI